MFIKQGISVGNLLLDLNNYRHGKQPNQNAARNAIIADQGRKLLVLAQDIIEFGMNPFDSPMVIDANDGQKNFIVAEGNRRLTAVALMLNPDLATGTAVHKGFIKLHNKNADGIPRVFECVIAPNRKAARVWIERKHSIGLEGAGTEHWSGMAKARADEEAGIPRVDLDAVNFVLSNPNLDPALRAHLEGGSFNLSTLQRLVTTSELQGAAGFSMEKGRLVASVSEEWLQGVMTDLVQTIAIGKRGAEKFTERTIDSSEKRDQFVQTLVAEHTRKVASKPWTVTGSPKTAAVVKIAKSSTKSAPTTEEQVNLVPKKFRLELPSGKINDVFSELKTLNVVTYRHSVSVLFRVFFDLTLDDYIRRQALQLPKDKSGNSIDKMAVRIQLVLEHCKSTKLMTAQELKPINTAVSNGNSLLAPDTLNAYVHSAWMNPDPLELKITWANVQLFIERMWSVK